jgi:succinyl-CoA synthetase beta subunit
MLAERMPPQKEYYAAILNDRATGGAVLVTSSQGGMNIEEVAHSDPSAIITTPLDFDGGISKEEGVKLAEKLGFKPEARENAAQVFDRLYTIFKEKDATQIEINPLAEMKDGQVLWCVASVPVWRIRGGSCRRADHRSRSTRTQHGRQVWFRRQRRLPSTGRLQAP